jgi:hypothetical protein
MVNCRSITSAIESEVCIPGGLPLELRYRDIKASSGILTQGGRSGRRGIPVRGVDYSRDDLLRALSRSATARHRSTVSWRADERAARRSE